jgi:chaperonin cofactor prefoldin
LSTLEDKVDKHNHVIERTYALEQKTAILDERIEELRKELQGAC